jgi:mono/diheme cytochrome c family protein
MNARLAASFLAMALCVGIDLTAAEPVRLHDISGAEIAPLSTNDKKAIVLIFITNDCPIANGYAPEIKRLCTEYSAKSVAFYLVHVDPSLTPAEAKKHASDFGFDCPVLLDPTHALVKAVDAKITPEAFVFSNDAKLLYCGRIDDKYIDFGKNRAEATTHDLRGALDAVLANKPVATAETKAIGCFIAPAAAASDRPVTFTKDIAPIMYQNCAVCHRSGDVAPFALMTYDDVKKRAKQVAAVTHSRYMPPWKAEPGYGDFQDARRLSDEQIATIRKWADTGAAEGDAKDLPPAPKFADGWRLGPPDLVLKMSKPYSLVAEGRDVFRCFVLPLNISEDKFVRAVEYRPSNRKIVHHALFFLDSLGQAKKKEKDASDGQPGFSSFGGPGFLPTGGLGGWAPGAFPEPLPDGLGRLLKKGSDIVIQTHFHPDGKVEEEQSEIGIYFCKTKPEKIVTGVPLGNRNIDIPAGKNDYKVTSSFTTPVDLEIVGLSPHAHLICKDMKGNATLPDGTKKPLIWIKDWDFNWQGQYLYTSPIKIPKGSVLSMEYTYDNSSENERNPNNPPKRVTFGEQTANEMAFLFLSVVTATPAESGQLRLAMLKQAIMKKLGKDKDGEQ